MRLLHLMTRGNIAAVLVTATLACTSLARPPKDLTQSPAVDPTFVTDGPGCERARELARRDPDSREVIPPAPKTAFVPVASAYPLNGATLIMRVRVDPGGRAVPSTGRVVRHDNGVLVPGYKTDITTALEKLTFRPAVLSGCAVEGVATLLYNTRR